MTYHLFLLINWFRLGCTGRFEVEEGANCGFNGVTVKVVGGISL